MTPGLSGREGDGSSRAFLVRTAPPVYGGWTSLVLIKLVTSFLKCYEVLFVRVLATDQAAGNIVK